MNRAAGVDGISETERVRYLRLRACRCWHAKTDRTPSCSRFDCSASMLLPHTLPLQGRAHATRARWPFVRRRSAGSAGVISFERFGGKGFGVKSKRPAALGRRVKDLWCRSCPQARCSCRLRRKRRCDLCPPRRALRGHLLVYRGRGVPMVMEWVVSTRNPQ
jgi:hypothetical protein